MGTFFRTFFCCLIISVSFIAYKYFKSESYNPDLSVNSNNPVYNNYNKFEGVKKQDKETLPIEDKMDEIPAEKPQKYEYTCYFYSGSGKLVPVKREYTVEQSLENNIEMLLKGPTIKESQQGIYSEIPKNVDLISVKQKPDAIIVNLTSVFGQGGGSQSVENRVKQLSKTVKNRVKNKKVYLYIDNKEVEYLGGEGIYINQPLN